MRVLLILVLAALSLTACSSSKHNSSTTTTTTAAAVSTSTATSSTESSTTTTTAPSTTTTRGSNNASSVKIGEFTTVGASKTVECNAPTMIELKWTTSGATKVTLAIDGPGIFGTYAPGAHDSLFPLACDGHAHSYTLVASGPNGSVTSVINVATKQTS